MSKIRIIAELPGGYRWRGGQLKKQLFSLAGVNKVGSNLHRSTWPPEINAAPWWRQCIWLMKAMYGDGGGRVWVYREPKHNRKNKSRYIQHTEMWGIGEILRKRRNHVEANQNIRRPREAQYVPAVPRPHAYEPPAIADWEFDIPNGHP